MRSYDQRIAAELNIQPQQVAATIQLLDEGNTIPFIARYRKELTLNLDEFRIRQIEETVTRLRVVDDRRDTILKSIDEQGKLTPQLKHDIELADSITVLEDLYQPYKPKRRTRASMARERGLEALANLIIEQPRNRQTPEDAAQAFLNADVATIDEALAGARDIVAEIISDHADVRGTLRQRALTWASLKSERIKDADDPKQVYETYYDFDMRVDRIRPYQTLAINRGETEKVLRVKVEIPERDWRDTMQQYFRIDQRSAFAGQLELAMDDSAKRLLLPAIERDVRRQLTDEAEAHAIDVFATNLRGLLMQPPLSNHIVMGIDPAYRTGCKIAVISRTGSVLFTTTIYPHKPQSQEAKAKQVVEALLVKYKVTLIAIGNGTASRETEAFIAQITRQQANIAYLIVNEAGASVYSASELARDELPDLDVSIRGAVSIARRAQDPLAELVKIDPKSIGVGLYQHDVNQSHLSKALDATVESVVNQVGVDVNTASPALLQYVAGVGPKLAANIVTYRDENGEFSSRAAIKKVSGMGPKAFLQAAGFLRIREAKNKLDTSAIHPESYDTAKTIIKQARLNLEDTQPEREKAIQHLLSQTPVEKLAKDLNTGVPTLQDILDQLVQPGRDPRDNVPKPILRQDVLTMADLQDGMVLDGTVRNVVDFGAFVDIGVKQDGLLHISQFPYGVKLKVGDIIKVCILNVDHERGRIGLGWPD